MDNRQALAALAATMDQLGVVTHWGSARQPADFTPGQAGQPDWVLDCRGLGARAQWPQLRGLRGEVVRLHAPDVTLQRRIYELQLRSDSVAFAMRSQESYLDNLRKVLGGNLPNERTMNPLDTAQTRNYRNITDKRSPEDSILRTEYDNANKYNLFKSDKSAGKGATMRNITFFTPVKGIVTSQFDPLRKHFGIDIVAARDEVIKSVQDGTIIFSGWTVETGYVIAIQHPGNVISVYKHNSVLLKKEGNIVHAGETVAIIGQSGELSTGPHLHLELWINGIPVNPKDYIVF